MRRRGRGDGGGERWRKRTTSKKNRSGNKKATKNWERRGCLWSGTFPREPPCYPAIFWCPVTAFQAPEYSLLTVMELSNPAGAVSELTSFVHFWTVLNSLLISDDVESKHSLQDKNGSQCRWWAPLRAVEIRRQSQLSVLAFHSVPDRVSCPLLHKPGFSAS